MLAVGIPVTGQESNAIVRGVVRDLATGHPVAQATVRANISPLTESTTDSNGNFVIRLRAPAQLSLTVVAIAGRGITACGSRNTSGIGTGLKIALSPGEELAGIELTVPTGASISGTILDNLRRPQSGIKIALLEERYALGKPRYTFVCSSMTNARGEYFFNAVEAEHPYILFAESEPPVVLTQWNEGPPAILHRRPAEISTFYPTGATPELATVISLRSGEHRSLPTMMMMRSEHFCADVMVKTSYPLGESRLGVGRDFPTHGYSGSLTLFSDMIWRNISPSGARVCGLEPGEYRVVVRAKANNAVGDLVYGDASVWVSDHDLPEVLLFATPQLKVSGTVAWETRAELANEHGSVRLSIFPVRRAPLAHDYTVVNVTVPGTFAFSAFHDDYQVKLLSIPAGAYIKDIKYGGLSIVNRSFRPSSANGQLDIVLGRDGGVIHATVVDSTGNPVANALLLAFRRDTSWGSDILDNVLSGFTDNFGTWTSPVLPPGQYIVLKASWPFLRGHELAEILKTTHGTELDVPPHSVSEVTIEQ